MKHGVELTSHSTQYRSFRRRGGPEQWCTPPIQ